MLPAVLLILLVVAAADDKDEKDGKTSENVAVVFPVPPHQRPGPAEASLTKEGIELVLHNRVLEASWTLIRHAPDHLVLQPGRITNRLTGVSITLPREAFVLHHTEHRVIHSSMMKAEAFRLKTISPDANSSDLGRTFAGWRAELKLQGEEVNVKWSAELRNDANYVRVAVGILPQSKALDMEQLILFDSVLPGSRPVGQPPGNVLTTEQFFFGYEHPQADNGDGSLPEEGGGIVLQRFVPGERQGAFQLEADVSYFLMKNHQILVYLDNRHSDVPVHIMGVELVDSLGNIMDRDFGHQGISSRNNHKGNIFALKFPDAFSSSTSVQLQRFSVRLQLHGEGNYTGEWVLGLHRKGLQDHAFCALRQQRRISEGTMYQGSMILGVAPQGQLRRAFLHYLERERAHPTRPMLHYNSWYDLGTGDQFSAKQAQETLKAIGSELRARGLNLDAFLLDDGWDDPDQGPWHAHQGFENTSLTDLESSAASLRTGLGVWFSPFGGYHEPRQRRISAARRAGLPVREEIAPRIKAVRRNAQCTETAPCEVGEGTCSSDKACAGDLFCFVTKTGANPPGVDATDQDKSLNFCADPTTRSAFLGLGIEEYYVHFRETVAGWLHRGARLLKLDGIGNPAGSAFTSAEDFDAAVSLIAELRRISRDVFINLSTGTWPSPFWLLSADTVWRRGHDHYFEGQGCARERWITYRDNMVYRNIVSTSALFPLNSLMIHGIIFAKDAWDLKAPEGAGLGLSEIPFRHEVRSAFGSGTMLQELYLTPSLLSSVNWDDIAVAAKWVRPLMGTLADTHWFGGSPEKQEVYGWAAWRDADREGNNQSAVLTIRNPSASEKNVELDAAIVFELPQHAGRTFELSSPFSDQRPRTLRLQAGKKVHLKMQPFEVLVFDSVTPPATRFELWLDVVYDIGKPVLFAIVACMLGFAYIRQTKREEAVVPDAEQLRQKRLAALNRLDNNSSNVSNPRLHIH